MRGVWALSAVALVACSDAKQAIDGGPIDGGSADGGSIDGGPLDRGRVALHGAVAKGPFILGSSLTVAPVDATGNPTGSSFLTETSDDLGDFAVEIGSPGPALLQASGYYYNEVTGTLSASTMTLSAYADLAQSGEQTVYVNLITQLTHGRVKALLLLDAGPGGAGDAGDAADAGDAGSVATPLEAAVSQAESELFAALGIGGSGYDAGAAGTQMNLLTGDNNANAYLFAVSAIFVQAAIQNSAGDPLDAALQKLINTTASTFAQSGTIDAATLSRLRAAEQTVEPNALMANLAAYFVDAGAPITIPDVDRALDSDLDGIPNDQDNCPLVANATQDSVNAVCAYKQLAFPLSGESSQVGLYIAGDFNGDNAPDLVVVARTSAQILLNDGDGGLGAAASISLSGLPPAPDGIIVAKGADLDGDGNLDLVVLSEHQTGPYIGNGGSQIYRLWSSELYWLKGDGLGGFAAAELSIPPADLSSCDPLPPYPATCPVNFRGFGDFVVADLDGDGRPDVAGPLISTGPASTPFYICPECDDTSYPPCPGDPNGNQLAVALALADGGFATPVVTKFDPAVGLKTGNQCGATPAIAIGDLNGDQKMDLVLASNAHWLDVRVNVDLNDVSDGLDSETGGLFALLGNGDGTFTALAVNTSGGDQLSSVALADVDGDGLLDAVVATQAQCPEGYPCHTGYFFGPDGGGLATESVTVLFGDGTGDFGNPTTVTFSPVPSEGLVGYPQETMAPAVADFTGDGHPDISLFNQIAVSSGRVIAAPVTIAFPPKAWRVTPNSWTRPQDPWSGTIACINCWMVTTADFNGDGRADLIGPGGGISPEAFLLYLNPPGWGGW